MSSWPATYAVIDPGRAKLRNTLNALSYLRSTLCGDYYITCHMIAWPGTRKRKIESFHFDTKVASRPLPHRSTMLHYASATAKTMSTYERSTQNVRCLSPGNESDAGHGSLHHPSLFQLLLC